MPVDESIKSPEIRVELTVIHSVNISVVRNLNTENPHKTSCGMFSFYSSNPESRTRSVRQFSEIVLTVC